MFKKVIFDVVIIILLSVLLFFITTKAWLADLSVPFYYLTDKTNFPWLNFDINLYLAILKNISEGNWITEYPRLAAPNVLLYTDYPHVYFEQFPFLIIKLLFILGFNLGESVNIFYILTFLLVAVASYLMFISINISRYVAIILSLIFAFLPYHMMNGQMHLCLSFYISVPLTLILCFWIMQGKFFINGTFHLKYLFFTLLILLLISSNDAYYFAYTVLFILSSLLITVLGVCNNRLKTTLLGATILILYIFGNLLLVPNIIPDQKIEDSFYSRGWEDTEFWGLKIIQLILPVRGHFLDSFNTFTKQYGPYPIAHVNEIAALGMITSIAFLVLMFITIFYDRVTDNRIKLISKLNLLGIFFGTVGGISTILAFIGYCPVRANYRISIYIALFSLVLAGVLLDYLINRFNKNKSFIYILIAIFSFVGILDQNGYLAIPNYPIIEKQFYLNQNFFSKVESYLGENAQVLQLPYAKFPEGGTVGKIKCYEQFIPFIHTNLTKWSYGVFNGTQDAEWQKQLSQMEVSEMIAEVKKKGFNAILIDSYGYKKDFDNIYSELKKYFVQYLVSEDSRYFVFKIS